MDYFNKEWTIFINIKLKEKYINLYNDYLSSKKRKTKNIYFYINKITNRQRIKIKEIFEKCNCCTTHKYYVKNSTNEFMQHDYDYDYDYISLYSRCRCPCREIIEIIEIIEQDIYYIKMDEKFNKMYKNIQHENKYLKISKILSNKSYEYLNIDELNEDEWIYYHPITQEKIQ